MSGVETQFDDASAFFALFRQSPWKSCHLKIADMEIFVARDSGMSSPEGAADAALQEIATATLRAPHLGTLVALADIGARLAAGQSYARLELLGEIVDLLADMDGLVLEQLQPLGTLIEYDQPLLSLS